MDGVYWVLMLVLMMMGRIESRGTFEDWTRRRHGGYLESGRCRG